jgi:hypothetical protein
MTQHFLPSSASFSWAGISFLDNDLNVLSAPGRHIDFNRGSYGPGSSNSLGCTWDENQIRDGACGAERPIVGGGVGDDIIGFDPLHLLGPGHDLALDNAICANGVDWDQSRSIYLSASCGPKKRVRGAVSKVYDWRFDRRNDTTLMFLTAATRCSDVISGECLYVSHST